MSLLNKYPMLVRHLIDAGAIVANAEFERVIVKLQMWQEPSLTWGEKHQIRRFLKPMMTRLKKGMAMNCLMHSRIIVTERRLA